MQQRFAGGAGAGYGRQSSVPVEVGVGDQLFEGETTMRILMSGSSGMVGRGLAENFREGDFEVFRLLRHTPDGEKNREAEQGKGWLKWNPYGEKAVEKPGLLEGFDAVVHLSGENLTSGRWTDERKQAFRDSRVIPTRALAGLLAGRCEKPKVLVCASATGWYGERGDEVLTEDSAAGKGYLPELCRDWEAAAEEAERAGIRVVHLRFGVILSRDGGALKKMLPVFRAGMGGRLGSGRQWMSWVTLADVVAAIRFAIEDAALGGPVNVTSPHPVTNAEFTRTMGEVLRRPTLFPVPAFALRMLFGEMADATILSSARVVPQRLMEAGFRFQHPRLAEALQAVLREPAERMASPGRTG